MQGRVSGRLLGQWTCCLPLDSSITGVSSILSCPFIGLLEPNPVYELFVGISCLLLFSCLEFCWVVVQLKLNLVAVQIMSSLCACHCCSSRNPSLNGFPVIPHAANGQFYYVGGDGLVYMVLPISDSLMSLPDSGVPRDPVTDIISCPHCARGFTGHLSLEKHREAVHAGLVEARGHVCLKCDRVYDTASGLVQHSQDVHPLPTSVSGRVRSYGQFLCGDCSEVFPDRQLLDIHRSEQHFVVLPADYRGSPLSVEVDCYVCAASFPSKLFLDQHLRNVHDIFVTRQRVPSSAATRFLCHCGRMYTSRDSYIHHSRSHLTQVPGNVGHGSVGEQHACLVCDAICGSAMSLARHVYSSHGGAGALASYLPPMGPGISTHCPFCGYYCSNPSDFCYHAATCTSF